jgi:hypothetical protein
MRSNVTDDVSLLMSQEQASGQYTEGGAVVSGHTLTHPERRRRLHSPEHRDGGPAARKTERRSDANDFCMQSKRLAFALMQGRDSINFAGRAVAQGSPL